jgi:DNA polymerase III subunit delta
MAAPKPETLLAEAIKTGRFDAVYAFHGENDFRKEEALRQVIARAAEPSTRDFNVDVLRGGETDPQTLEVALNALPMLAERRVLVLRDPGALKKNALARLEAYLENPSESTVLVLLYPTGSEVPAKIARIATVVELEPLSGERLIKWIIRQTETAHSAEITRDAAVLLQEAVGNDLLDLAGELDKLASYTEGARIETEAVSAVVGVRPGETVVSLLEAVAERDVPRALRLVPLVLRQPKVSGVTLVMSLGAQMLGIGWCRARRDTGSGTQALQREGFGVARRVFQFMDSRPAGERLSAWIRASADWPAPDVVAALDALLAADVALKETRVASEAQIVSTAVLAACAGAGRASAAA